jgi:hypothetical protein
MVIPIRLIITGEVWTMGFFRWLFGHKAPKGVKEENKRQAERDMAAKAAFEEDEKLIDKWFKNIVFLCERLFKANNAWNKKIVMRVYSKDKRSMLNRDAEKHVLPNYPGYTFFIYNCCKIVVEAERFKKEERWVNTGERKTESRMRSDFDMHFEEEEVVKRREERWVREETFMIEIDILPVKENATGDSAFFWLYYPKGKRYPDVDGKHATVKILKSLSDVDESFLEREFGL